MFFIHCHAYFHLQAEVLSRVLICKCVLWTAKVRKRLVCFRKIGMAIKCIFLWKISNFFWFSYLIKFLNYIKFFTIAIVYRPSLASSMLPPTYFFKSVATRTVCFSTSQDGLNSEECSSPPQIRRKKSQQIILLMLNQNTTRSAHHKLSLQCNFSGIQTQTST